MAIQQPYRCSYESSQKTSSARYGQNRISDLGFEISDLKSQIAGRAETLKSCAENLELSSFFHIFVLKFGIWNLEFDI